MQTSYAINIPSVSFPGQPADTGIRDVTSASAVAAAIPYGVLVVRDTSHGVPGTWEIAGKVPSLTTDITVPGSALGVSLADQARAQNPSVVLPTYPQFTSVPTMRIGRVWVTVETAVVAGHAAFVRFASTVNGTQLGSFRADADTISSADAAVALPGAYFVTSQATPGGYAVVELSLV